MKKLSDILFAIICFGLILFLFSCKKPKFVPVPAPHITDNLYQFNTDMQTVDTAMVFVNGSKIKDSLYCYNIELNKGDTVSFHFSGNNFGPGFKFAIWKNENTLPEASINYFYAKKFRVIKKYSLGLPNYCDYYILTGQYIVK